MRRWTILGCALALTFAVGCDNGDNGGTDSGPVPTDSGNGGNGFPDLPAVMALDGDDLVAADFSCMGSRTAPTNGDPTDFPVQVNDFQSGNAVPNAVVQIFDDNVVPATDDCGDCFEFTADAEGRGTATASAGGWFAVRVLGIEGTTARTLQYNLVPPSGTQTALSISNSTLNTVPALVGLSRQAGTGVLAGSARDCNDLTVAGVVLRIFLADGTEVPASGGRTEPGFFYFSESTGLPAGSEEFTTSNGQFGAANLAASTEPARLEVWGRLEAGGEIQRLGCEESSIVGDTISIINVGPSRSDGC